MKKFMSLTFAHLRACLNEYTSARAELATCHAELSKTEKILRLERELLACHGISVELPTFYRQPSNRERREQERKATR